MAGCGECRSADGKVIALKKWFQINAITKAGEEIEINFIDESPMPQPSESGEWTYWKNGKKHVLGDLGQSEMYFMSACDNPECKDPDCQEARKQANLKIVL